MGLGIILRIPELNCLELLPEVAMSTHSRTSSKLKLKLLERLGV